MIRAIMLAAAALALASPAHAQGIRIWPGTAPGSEHWTQQPQTFRNTPVGTVEINIVTPTLTPYLPPPARATGTAVIIAPGGGFVALALSRGGTDVARWFQQHGIAAFLLRYRTVEKLTSGIPEMDQDTAGRYGIADGIQALKVVRQRAAEWGVDPHRVGVIGFSAGGMVASAVLLQPDSSARPDFAALIYGAPFGKMPVVPRGLPPVFMAWASDDDIAGQAMVRLHDALMAASDAPEVHIYSAGGHGFGMAPQGTTSDHWADELYYWLDAKGFTRRSPATPRAPRGHE